MVPLFGCVDDFILVFSVDPDFACFILVFVLDLFIMFERDFKWFSVISLRF